MLEAGNTFKKFIYLSGFRTFPQRGFKRIHLQSVRIEKRKKIEKLTLCRTGNF